MRRHHRLPPTASLATASLLFLPAPARAQGVEVTDLAEKSSVIETNDTLIGKIPRW